MPSITDGEPASRCHIQQVRKVLVAYASRHGGTAEIAETIADKLREYDLTVVCLPVASVTGLSSYDAVVLGSAVYFNHWRPDAARFLRQHGHELSQRPFWAFSSGPVGEAQPGPQWHEPHRIMAEVRQLHARGHVVFGGRVSTIQDGPVECLMVQRLPPASRDRRDWGDVRTWASQIASQLDARRRRSPETPAARRHGARQPDRSPGFRERRP